MIREAGITPDMFDALRALGGFQQRRRQSVRVEASGCWTWLGHIIKKGYGRRKESDGSLWVVHRLVYTELHGPIPDGFQLDHLCRTRSCVNPMHLEVVLPAENTRRGDSAKITLDLARSIRADYVPHQNGYKRLAVRYGISPRMVWFIVKGQAWKEAA
jgi:hypothetical protein